MTEPGKVEVCALKIINHTNAAVICFPWLLMRKASVGQTVGSILSLRTPRVGVQPDFKINLVVEETDA
jgi:hypothetical protein